MNKNIRRLVAFVMISPSGIALAQNAAVAPATPAMEPAATVPGWNDFVDGLRILPGQMQAKLPAAMCDDPQVRAEVGRLALASLASSATPAQRDQMIHDRRSAYQQRPFW